MASTRQGSPQRRNPTPRNTRRPVSETGSRSSSRNNKKPAKVGANASIMRAMVITLVVMVLVVGVLALFVFFPRNTVAESEYNIPAAEEMPDTDLIETETDTIYENIFISGVDVGGLTVPEAEEVLLAELITPLYVNEITITYEDINLTYSYEDFGAYYDIEPALAQAYNYTRLGTTDEVREKREQLTRQVYEIEAPFNFDPNAVRTAVSALSEYIVFEFKDATMRRENGQFIVTPESGGKRLDIEATSLAVADLLHNQDSGIVEAVVSVSSPAVTSLMFMNAQSLLGSFKTVAAAGDANRTQNVINAASKINNVVVMPGEVFSTNKAFGEMTYDNGYREGNVIVGGEFEKQFGGGVCQVSSTLYVALLYAELKIVERQNHSLKVGYADYGYDATLAGDYIDLKFENDTEYPVLIESYLVGNDVFVNIYGHESRPAGREIKFSNNLLETREPPEPRITEDDTLPLGFEEVDSQARVGYRYELIKHIYQNGEYVSSTRVNYSTYRAVAAEVRVGTNPDIPWPADQQPPEPQEPAEPGDGTPDPGDVITDPGDNTPDPGDNLPDPGDNTPDPNDNTPDPGDNLPDPGDNTPDPDPADQPDERPGPPPDWPEGIPWNP